jgi:hypothetical protein
VFVTYEDRSHRMVNPIETTLIAAITGAVAQHSPDDAPAVAGESPTSANGAATSPTDRPAETVAKIDHTELSVGVVTPHNAQRGAFESCLPASITANTVEKYQGGERDIIAVSATVSDPAFARQEEQFILNPNRLLVAISRSRLLTVIVCSTALFEVAPADSDRLSEGPVWARLYTQAVGRDSDPAWAGPLAEFTGKSASTSGDVPVAVYPSTIDPDETRTHSGDQP